MYTVIFAFHDDNIMDGCIEAESFETALGYAHQYGCPDIAIGIFDANGGKPIWEQLNEQGLGAGEMGSCNP